MADRVKDMTSGKPLGLIVAFALPLMVGNVFQQLYTVVDTMVVGRALGVDALAALGATDWLTWMVLGMVQGFTQGFGILMAREFGAKQYDRLRAVVGNSLFLTVVCSLGLLALAQGLVLPMLRLLETPDRILGNSELYLRILFSGTPILAFYNLAACVLRALGDGRTPLNAMILASLTNIGLDVLFVVGFGWGIPGAASATLIAQASAAVFCLLRLRRISFLRLGREDLRPKAQLDGKLLALGWPMALQCGIIALGGLIIQWVVNGRGVTFLAGYTATNKIFGVMEMAAVSFGYAMVTYAGQNLGAGKLSRIRQGTRWAVGTALIISAIISCAMLLFGRGVLAQFLSGEPGEVALATESGYRYLVVICLGLPVLYVLHVVRSAIQGMGNTVLPMVSGIVEFIMRTGCVLVLPALLGETGIYLAEVAAWVGADFILIPSYFYTLAGAGKRISPP